MDAAGKYRYASLLCDLNKFKVANQTVAYARGFAMPRWLPLRHLPGLSPESSSKETKRYFNNPTIDTASIYPFQKLILNHVGDCSPKLFIFQCVQTKTQRSAIFISIWSSIQPDSKDWPNWNSILDQSLKKRPETEKQLLVGNDVLIDPKNPSKAIKKIAEVVKKDPKLVSWTEMSLWKNIGG